MGTNFTSKSFNEIRKNQAHDMYLGGGGFQFHALIQSIMNFCS